MLFSSGFLSSDGLTGVAALDSNSVVHFFFGPHILLGGLAGPLPDPLPVFLLCVSFLRHHLSRVFRSFSFQWNPKNRTTSYLFPWSYQVKPVIRMPFVMCQVVATGLVIFAYGSMRSFSLSIVATKSAAPSQSPDTPTTTNQVVCRFVPLIGAQCNFSA